MHFEPTAEQQQLQDTVARFLAGRYGFEERRKILRSPAGWSRAVWGQLAELGLLGLLVPEEHGGLGGGLTDLLVAARALGPGLLLEPFLASAVMATALVREAGSAAQRERLLPALAQGERVLVLAHEEAGARGDLDHLEARATRVGAGYRIEGHKAVVLHAPAADELLVSARTGPRSDSPGDGADGVSLFLVAPGAPGVTLRPCRTLDGLVAADVVLDGVEVEEAARVGTEGAALPAIAGAVDLGLVALIAEAAGVLQGALDQTIEYTKTRKQFGQPIARFQALQHRMADMLMHVEQARSMAFLAAMHAGDADLGARRRALSAAKVLVGQACRFVGQQAVQLHGGMGVTDDLPISHSFKRLTAIELTLGDGAYHLERFVALSR